MIGSMCSYARGGPNAASSILPIPYFSYLRHLDTHNFVFASKALGPELQQLDAMARPGDRNEQDSQPLSVARGQSLFPAIFLQSLVRLSKAQDLRMAMMLTEITAENWESLLPDLFSCHQLQKLSLDNPEGLDAAAASAIMEKLPSLIDLTVIRPDVTGVRGLVSFVSALKPDHLRSFNCSFSVSQAPLLGAIAGLAGLQELGLTFVRHAPVHLHILAPLTNLTSLTLSIVDYVTLESELKFVEWATKQRETFAKWLTSCRSLVSLHISKMPALVPAVTDALPHLRLERLHVNDTGSNSIDHLYRALKSQRLRYLFIAEPVLGYPISGLTEQGEVDDAGKERAKIVLDAVLAMPCLRHLMLHTDFEITWDQVREMARCVPRLEKLSYVVGGGWEEHPHTLEALEGFKHLTSLTILGETHFSAEEVLDWIERTRCHLRRGGFSLCLPSQFKMDWYDEVLRVLPCAYRHAPTNRIKELLRFFRVRVRGPGGQGGWWAANTFERYDEEMFYMLWGEVRGPVGGLRMISGIVTIYSPYERMRRYINVEIA